MTTQDHYHWLDAPLDQGAVPAEFNLARPHEQYDALHTDDLLVPTLEAGNMLLAPSPP